MSSGTATVVMTRYGNPVPFRLPTRSSEFDSVVELETKDLDFGDAENDKYVDEWVLNVDSDMPNAFVYVGTKGRIGDVVKWSDPIPLMKGGISLRYRAAARLFRLKLTDGAPQNIWKMVGIEVYGKMSLRSRQASHGNRGVT